MFSKLQNAFNESLDEYQEFRKDAARLMFLNVDALADVADRAIDFQTSLYKKGGVIFGNEQSSIGPRYVVVPCKNIPGALVTERTFLGLPCGFDKMFITIEQTDGKSSANIAVCIKDKNGILVNKKEKNLDGEGKKVEFVFYGTEDKYYSIHLVKPIGPNNFEYKLAISGEMNAEKEDLAKYIKECEDELAKKTKTPVTHIKNLSIGGSKVQDNSVLDKASLKAIDKVKNVNSSGMVQNISGEKSTTSKSTAISKVNNSANEAVSNSQSNDGQANEETTSTEEEDASNSKNGSQYKKKTNERENDRSGNGNNPNKRKVKEKTGEKKNQSGNEKQEEESKKEKMNEKAKQRKNN